MMIRGYEINHADHMYTVTVGLSADGGHSYLMTDDTFTCKGIRQLNRWINRYKAEHKDPTIIREVLI